MKNRIGFNRLSRRPAHRKALKRNMVTSLLLEERITTTQTKAMEVRRMAEKMVTRAKEDSVHNRRMIARDVKDKKALAKLFSEIGPRFKSRPGGYTRVLKLGPRQGDAAEMVLLEFVERSGTEQPEPKKKKADAKKTEAKKADSKKSTAKDQPATEKKTPKARTSVAAPVTNDSVDAAADDVKTTPEESSESTVADPALDASADDANAKKTE